MRITRLLKKPEIRAALAAGGAFFVVLVVCLAFLFFPRSTQELFTPPSVEPVVFRHPLTGVEVPEPLAELPHVFGVMIENSLDAWPLAGIEEAFLVIEAPVEGGIPRFLAFYSTDQDVTKIGPVRSARPYYVDWNDELDALYAHVGGSPEALDKIKAVGTPDLNEFYQGEYYWRGAAPRYAPHNVYTSTENLTEALDEFSELVPDYDAWLFADGVSSGLDRSLLIEFGGAYDVTWRYDAITNRYLREQAGDIYPIEGSGFVMADNIVVLATDIAVIDSIGRRSIRTLGEGDALVVQNGNAILATWQKEDRASRLRFYRMDTGDEIVFNTGITWIEVVDALSRAETFSATLR